jgi:hypothetical protein
MFYAFCFEHMRTYKVSTVALIIVAFALTKTVVAGPAVITFNEFPAMNNNQPLTTAYAGVGVTFDNRNSGTWGGLANGNPGNWAVNGVSGPQFLGINGVNDGDTYAESFFFAAGQSSVSFDASRTEGSSEGQTLTADAYNSLNNLVATETITLGDINEWSLFTLDASDIVRVDTDGSADGFSPYGISDLEYNTVNAVPDQASTLVLASLSGLSLLLFRRQRI